MKNDQKFATLKNENSIIACRIAVLVLYVEYKEEDEGDSEHNAGEEDET